MSTRFIVLFLAALFASACTRTEAPAQTESGAASAPASAPAPAADEPKTVADIFPPAPEKEVVLSSCGTCHNVACSAIGQRPAGRWDDLRKSHADRVSGVNVDGVFAYLKTHFDDSKPEPKVPPAFLEGGCTPY